MTSEKILESFVEENIGIAKKILFQLKEIDSESSEKIFLSILENVKIIKNNARIMDFQWLEKFCNGYEEILVALITKNLYYTTLLNDFLVEATQQIEDHIISIKNKKEESPDNLEQWIIDCDKIAAGIILDHKNKTVSESEKIPEQKNVIISSQRLNEMLKTFDDISIQRSRLKQQSMNLENFDSAGGIEFSRLRKNIASTINNLEDLIQNVQDQLQEAGMANISHTLNEFQIKNFAEKCKIEIEAANLMMDKTIVPHLSKILNLFLANAKEYGFKNIADPRIHIGAKKNGDLIELTFKDNGNGIDFEELRQNIVSTFPQRKKEILEMDEEALGMVLFTAGMTPRENGLHMAWNEIEKIKGKLTIHSAVGDGTTFIINFPKSLSSETGFTIKYGESKFFIPSHYVLESVSKNDSELITDTPKPYFEHRDQKIRIYRLSSILPLATTEAQTTKQDANTILVIKYLELKFGLVVDEVTGFSSKAIKSVPDQLKNIKEVEGIVIDENYDIIPVLNVPSLIKRFSWLRDYDLKRTEVAARKIVKNILVADPSVFARHIIRSIYENNGFYVEEAKDGIEAMEILKKKEISLIISAVEMPRMNGLTLLDNVRRDKEKNIPFILFPFEAEEDVEKSYLDLGAKFVIKKNNFDRNKLLEITESLI